MGENTSKVNVLYCESCMDGTVGGSHHCLLHIVENLDRSQYEPLVLFYDRHALLPRFQAVANTLVWTDGFHNPVRWSTGSGILSAPFMFMKRAVNCFRWLGTIAKYVSFIKKKQIDLVHLNNSITRHHEWLSAAIVAGIPCVVSERGQNQRYGVMDRVLACRLALIMPVSRWIMDHMVERGVAAHNIRVLYDGLDARNISVGRAPEAIREIYGIKPHQLVIGMVGNIRAWKGQETVVRALIEVSKVYPEIVCFFVGAATAEDQPYLDHLYGLLKEAGIEASARFTGYQSDPASFINAMRLLVHASVHPEPFGMVVLEGMAHRKAVIGSRAGGVIEIVVEGQTGYTFPPGDARLLAERIIELLGNPDKAMQMGEAGYQRLMTDFTLQRYMEDIHIAYQAVLARKSLPSNLGLTYSVKRHADD